MMIIHLFSNHPNLTILYYISMIIHGFIIIIMAFQSFLYLNIGNKLYHLLKSTNENKKFEQDNMNKVISNTTTTTNTTNTTMHIDHFIEHDKLTRNIINVSPLF